MKEPKAGGHDLIALLGDLGGEGQEDVHRLTNAMFSAAKVKPLKKAVVQAVCAPSCWPSLFLSGRSPL